MLVSPRGAFLASDADLPDLIPTPEPDRDLPPPSGKWRFGGGLVFSVLLHVLVTVLLIANLEWPFEETAPQPPIEVVILPQPEPQEEAQAPEAEPVETPETPEPAETEEAEEQPEPAPPPPPAPEDPAPEDPEPEQQESPAAPAILQPVVRFGEEDQAQAAEEDGSAPEPDEAADVSDPEADAETSETTDAEDPAEQPGDDGEAEETVEGGETPDEPTEDPTEEPAEETTEEPAAELEPETEPEPAPEPEPETAEPVEDPEAVNPEEVSEDPAETPEVMDEGNPEAPGIADTGVEPEDFGTVGRIVTDARPVSKPAAPPRTPARQTAQNQAQSRSGASGRPPLARARELFSSSILSDVRTQTAMRNMGPAERLNLLCMTELRAQLQDFDPSRPPEMLPSFRPRPGTILEPGAAAYQSRGQWYDLAFRCETDPDVREVSAFSFRIGPPIPRSEWGARGLPSF